MLQATLLAHHEPECATVRGQNGEPETKGAEQTDELGDENHDVQVLSEWSMRQGLQLHVCTFGAGPPSSAGSLQDLLVLQVHAEGFLQERGRLQVCPRIRGVATAGRWRGRSRDQKLGCGHRQLQRGLFPELAPLVFLFFVVFFFLRGPFDYISRQEYISSLGS